MSDGHEKLIGAAVVGITLGATINEHGKTGKWPPPVRMMLTTVGIAIISACGAAVSSGMTQEWFLGVAFWVGVFGTLAGFIWLVVYQIKRALRATHPSNFPQFENRPVPELAREMMAKPNMTERFITLHHDPTRRHIIMVPGHPDRICCQADGNWYDWDPYEGCYVFSGI